MEEYKILKLALDPYHIDYDLDNKQRMEWFLDNVNSNHVNINQLAKELNEAIYDKKFNWKLFFQENNLLENPSDYSDLELINYIKSLIWDYIYPEQSLDINSKKELLNDVIDILKNEKDWINSYDLYEKLKLNNKYKTLEYYNLSFLPYDLKIISIKPDGKKDRELGFLKYLKT